MIVEEIESILQRLREARDRYAFELEGMPEGRLVRSQGKDADRYYVARKEDGVYVRRGISRDKRLVETLARKEYLVKAVRIIEDDIRVMERAAQRYRPFDPQAVVGSLSATFRGLPREAFYDPLADVVALSLDAADERRIASHRQWGEQPFASDGYREEGRTVLTSRGERMRSKAEVMIAEKLYEYGIPFRYEQALEVGGTTFHPDFTFEGAGGQEFYLEFCGMMDNPSYVAAHQRKKAEYEQAGIVPWENIVYLYASGNEMNMMRVDSIVRTQIIPWL